ncbi:MAG TPA: hypothetical protein VJQ56_13060 [Blastocatellia bacterium]|nr:hypothetical protein [Blastocatellia bacterium]
MKRALVVFTLVLLAALSGLAQEGVQVSTKNNTEKELRKKEQLERLLKQHDLSKWIHTRAVLIDEQTGIPHSHPVLTLNADQIDDDPGTLSTFIHEQLHWLAEAKPAQKEKAIEELKGIYPQAPAGPPEGARNLYSTYLHLIVCYLEYDGMRELLGDEKARQLIEGLSKRYYKWVYRTVLNDAAKIKAVVEKHGLVGVAERKGYAPAPRHWTNPTIFVDLSGIFIISGDQGERRPTTIDDLAKELAQLPVAAWPSGRVVMLSQSARIPILVEGFNLGEREERARKTMGRVAEILRSLDLEIVYGPVT